MEETLGFAASLHNEFAFVEANKTENGFYINSNVKVTHFCFPLCHMYYMTNVISEVMRICYSSLVLRYK